MPKTIVKTMEARIGARVRSLRLLRKVSQADIGRVLGITWQQVQKYEKGKSRISASQLVRLAEAFNVSFDYFAPKLMRQRAPSEPDVVEHRDMEAAIAFAQTKHGMALIQAFARLDADVAKAMLSLLQMMSARENSR